MTERKKFPGVHTGHKVNTQVSTQVLGFCHPVLLPLNHSCFHISSNRRERGVKKKYSESWRGDASFFWSFSLWGKTNSDIGLFKCCGRPGQGANENSLGARRNKDIPFLDQALSLWQHFIRTVLLQQNCQIQQPQARNIPAEPRQAAF